MTNYLKGHRDRQSFIKTFLFASIATIALCYLFGCKKQVETKEAINLTETYFKVIEVDIDGKEWPSLVFHAKTELQMEDNGPHIPTEPLGWHGWTSDFRNWWCDQTYNSNNPFYCLICPEKAKCKVTPVTYTYAKIDGNVIKWGIATSASVSFYRIDYSKDAKVFKTLVTNIADHGIGDYVYQLKN